MGAWQFPTPNYANVTGAVITPNRTPAPAPVALPPDPVPGSSDCGCGYPGRIQFQTILGAFPLANVNPFADTDTVRAGWYRYVVAATFNLTGNGSASLGPMGLYVISPGQVAKYSRQPFQIGEGGGTMVYPTGPVKISTNYTLEDANSGYSHSIERPFVVPGGCFLKASLLQGAPGPGITSWQMQLSLMFIDLQNSEEVPNF